MGAIPVGLSVVATMLNAVFVLSGPAEIYFNGTMWMYVVVGFLVVVIPPTHFMLPVYRRLKLISAYQVCLLYHAAGAAIGEVRRAGMA